MIVQLERFLSCSVGPGWWHTISDRTATDGGVARPFYLISTANLCYSVAHASNRRSKENYLNFTRGLSGYRRGSASGGDEGRIFESVSFQLCLLLGRS